MPEVERGLPSNVDAERWLLGLLLIDGELYGRASEILSADAFSIESHRRIYSAMGNVHSSLDHIEIVTVAECLSSKGQFESCGGLTYLTELTSGIPRSSRIENLCRVIADKAILRKTIFAAQKVIDKAMLQEDRPADVLTSAAKDLGELSLSAGYEERYIHSPEEIVADVGFDRFFDPTISSPAISTGFESLDNLIYGFNREKTYILAGGTGDGKTLLSCQLAMNVARAGHPVLIFSLEMSKADLLQRMVCSEAEVSLPKFNRGQCNMFDKDLLKSSAARISEWPIYFEDTTRIPIDIAIRKLRKAVREKGIRLVIFDYIQIMDRYKSGSGIKFRDEQEMLQYSSLAIHCAARECGVSSLAISQFSRIQRTREKSDRRPKLSDLHGSSSLEKDARVIMALYRPERDAPERADNRGKVECIVLKHTNGPIGTVHLRFHPTYTKLVEDPSAPASSPD